MTSQLEMAVCVHFNYSVSADVQFVYKTIKCAVCLGELLSELKVETKLIS